MAQKTDKWRAVVAAITKLRSSEKAGILGLAEGLLESEDYFVALVSPSVSPFVSHPVIQSRLVWLIICISVH